MNNNLFSVGGFKIVIVPDQPKMQLSDRVCEVLTPEQIAHHNAWLRRFFGCTNVIDDGVVLFSEAGLLGENMFMNPRTHAAYKAATEQRHDGSARNF